MKERAGICFIAEKSRGITNPFPKTPTKTVHP